MGTSTAQTKSISSPFSTTSAMHARNVDPAICRRASVDGGTTFLNNNVTVRGRSPNSSSKKDDQGGKIADRAAVSSVADAASCGDAAAAACQGSSTLVTADLQLAVSKSSSYQEEVGAASYNIAAASSSTVHEEGDDMDIDDVISCASAIEEGSTATQTHNSEDDHIMVCPSSATLCSLHCNSALPSSLDQLVAFQAQHLEQQQLKSWNEKLLTSAHQQMLLMDGMSSSFGQQQQVHASAYDSSTQAASSAPPSPVRAAPSLSAASYNHASAASTLEITTLQSMHRILQLNNSAIALVANNDGGNEHLALDALQQAEWVRCHLADELLAARASSMFNTSHSAGHKAVGNNLKKMRIANLSSSWTSGESGRAQLEQQQHKKVRRVCSFGDAASPSSQEQMQSSSVHHRMHGTNEDVARTSYIYQRMDFDEGMHSFVNLESIDPTSFWLHSSASAAFHHEISPVIEATLIFNVGQVHRLLGDLDAASKCYDRALEVLQCGNTNGNITSPMAPSVYLHPSAIPILHNIGQLQYRRGDIHLSLETYAHALNCAQVLYGSHHPHVASALNCLGVLHYHDANTNDGSDESKSEVEDSKDEMIDDDDKKDGQPNKSTQKSMELFEQALAIRMETLGPNHVDVATILNNIGRIYVQSDEFDQALLYYEDALRIRKQVLGVDSLDYAATAFNAGQSFHQKGGLDRALELYHEFLRVALIKFEHSHRDVAVVLSGIAQIHQEKHEYDKALELYEASLCAGKAALGEDHSEIAMLLNRMGNFHFEQERLGDALNCYQRGLKIERAVLPPDHPNIVVTLSNLGEIHRQRNEWDEAAKMYDDCLDILRKKHVDEDHIDVASTLSTIGLIHDQRGDTCLSLHFLQDALVMRRRLLGNNHLDVSSTLVYIGTILYRKSVFSVALELFSESLRIRQAALGKDHRDVAFVLYNIALIHQQRGCHEEAIESYLETLRIEKLVLGGRHRDVSMTLFKLGEVNKAAGDLDEALKCFQNSLAVERSLSSSAAATTDRDTTISRGQGQQQPDNAAMARALTEIGNIHLARGDVVPMMEAFNEASRLYRAAGLSTNNVVVIENLYALELSCPEAAPAA